MSKRQAKFTRPSRRSAADQILRFAHPSFTTVPPEERTLIQGAQRMTDRIKDDLLPIPKVRGESVMTLSDVVGSAGALAIQNEKSIVFHTAGDTGHENGHAQEYVADAMTDDYKISQPA